MELRWVWATAKRRAAPFAQAEKRYASQDFSGPAYRLMQVGRTDPSSVMPTASRVSRWIFKVLSP
jgi:hypothetical protein